MRRRSTRRRAAAGAVALIAVIWAAGAAGASSSSLTLHANHLFVTYGQRVALSSVDTAQGQGVAHAAIAVQASEFPFKSGFHTIASGQTDASGHYRIKVAPTHATQYRVSLKDSSATSPTVSVYVIPKDQYRCNLCTFSNKPGKHTLIVSDVYQFPPGPIAATGPEYFYYGQRNGSPALPATIRLVETVPLRQIKGNKLQASVHYVVHVPNTVSRFTYVTCYKDDETRDGIGLPGHHHCGDPSLTRAEFSNYLG